MINSKHQPFSALILFFGFNLNKRFNRKSIKLNGKFIKSTMALFVLWLKYFLFAKFKKKTQRKKEKQFSILFHAHEAKNEVEMSEL